MKKQYVIGLVATIGILFLLVAALNNLVKQSEDPPKIPFSKDNGSGVETTTPLVDPRPEAPLRPSDRTVPKKPDAAALFRRFTQQYSERAKVLMKEQPTRFALEEHYCLREGRLLALAYPDEVSKAALAVIRDKSAPSGERGFACNILKTLAEKGDRAAEDELLRVASDKSDTLAKLALMKLAEVDQEGRYKSVYWQMSREGSLDAMRAIARWPDTTTQELMHDIVKANPGSEAPGCHRRLLAEENLKRLDLLFSLNVDATLAAIIENPKHELWHWTPWALEVARNRNSPRLAEAIRNRLDGTSTQARRDFERPTAASSEMTTFENSFTSSAYFDSITDPHFDTILVTQLEVGGPLTDLERRRLRVFGYGCDPKERLQELIGSIGK